jgi:membrane protein implicated in regulation of membrane protease activity
MYAIGGAAAAIFLYILLPHMLFWLIVVGAIAVPVVAYLVLDPSQRRRLRNQGRKRLGN